MKHYLYKLTDPNGKTYVGVTCNFKRRMKEHRRSDWPVGKAIRELGEENFKVELEVFDTKELALDREFELVSFDSLDSGNLYNLTVGGSVSNQLRNDNPMHRKEVLEKHPNLWSRENNPMNNEISKQAMLQKQKRKPVCIDGVQYSGVREAARAVGESRQLVVYRLKADSFPSWYYL
jgi:predicted GIY-YIG superfamily endonuclease